MSLQARFSLERLVRLRSLSPPVLGDIHHACRTLPQAAEPANDARRRQAPQPYMG